MSKTSEPILEARQLTKYFLDGGKRSRVLSNLDFSVKAGERVSITGPSGSGKTTLLYLLGGLDRSQDGTVLINGRDIHDMNETKLSAWRNLHLAYVLQQHHLLREFNTLENIAIPLLIRGISKKQAMQEARALLHSVGLERHIHHYPEQLSGGQAQRAAIAQALIGKPKCILMDEPTGNLDKENTIKIKELLIELSVKDEFAIVLATHNLELTQAMQTRWSLQDGQLIPAK